MIHNSLWNTQFMDQKMCSQQQQKKCEGKIPSKTMYFMKKKKETSETLPYQNLTAGRIPLFIQHKNAMKKFYLFLFVSFCYF